MLRIDWCRCLSINNDYCLIMTLLSLTTIDGNHSNASNETTHNVCRTSCNIPVIFVQLETQFSLRILVKRRIIKNFKKFVPSEEVVLCWQTHVKHTWRSQQSLFSNSQMHLKSCVTCNTYPINTYKFNYFWHNNTLINRNVRRINSDYAVQLAFRQGSAADIRTI